MSRFGSLGNGSCSTMNGSNVPRSSPHFKHFFDMRACPVISFVTMELFSRTCFFHSACGDVGHDSRLERATGLRCLAIAVTNSHLEFLCHWPAVSATKDT